MKRIICLILFCLFLGACKWDSEPKQMKQVDPEKVTPEMLERLGGKKREKAKPQLANVKEGNSSGGVSYTIYPKPNNTEPKVKMGNYLTMNMSYSTPEDSIIFSSFGRAKPLSIKFAETLFRGALNDGLQEMAAGDSAVFMVPAEKMYSRLPSFVKRGDQLKYLVKLIKVEEMVPPKK